MNDRPSPAARGDDDTPPSPKRKKVRAKYAPKACVSCRRSKLKCSGENPCQRCIDNGKRCFYSEDQTAAEALQNLSRPTPVQPPLALLGANGNGVARRSILPRHDAIERRASDASVLGISMEARMARLEGMMETLIQERAATLTPRGSMERDEAVSDSVQSDIVMLPAGDAFNPSLPRVRHSSFKVESPERIRHSLSGGSPQSSADFPSAIRMGSKSFAFPTPVDYQKYLDFFFNDLNPYYPCVNEAEFRMRSDKMLATRPLPANDICFLALHYVIFACVDIAGETSNAAHNKPPGWQWFQLASDLVGNRVLSGHGDLSLVQTTILEAVYLTAADKPNAAYNVIGVACRLAFQFGLNQQSSWRSHAPYEIYMRQHLIASTIPMLILNNLLVSLTEYLLRSPLCAYRDVHPDMPLPEPDSSRPSMGFLTSMICWARLAAEIWDRFFAASVTNRDMYSENALMMDAQIKQWIKVAFPADPLTLRADQMDVAQQTLVYTRFNHLRIVLLRQSLLSLKYGFDVAELCGDMAVDNFRITRVHNLETRPSYPFRFHVATCLGNSLFVLCALLIRDLSIIGYEAPQGIFASCFRDALTLLRELSPRLAIARRILDDFKDIVPVVSAIIDEQQQSQAFPRHLVPPNPAALFPYTSLDSSQQPGLDLLSLSLGLGQPNAADPSSTEEWGLDEAEKKRYGVFWL